MPDRFDFDRPATDPKTQRRVALNQATLRRLNEAISSGGELISFRCECGQLGCNQLITLGRADYDSVRAHPRRFAIAPGHEVLEIESPIERHDVYVVVETRATAANAVADQTSSRHAAGGSSG
jgi:hypothetical protein